MCLVSLSMQRSTKPTLLKKSMSFRNILMHGYTPYNVDTWIAAQDNVTFLAMPKFDGVRVIRTESGVYSRQRKLVPNTQLRRVLEETMPVDSEGEFVCGDYHRTCGIFNSTDTYLPSEAKVWMFDIFDEPSLSAMVRMVRLTELCPSGTILEVAPFVTVCNGTHIEQAELELLGQYPNCDGIMLKRREYIFGRCSVNRANLVKIKRVKHVICEVVSMVKLVSETGKPEQMGAVIVKHPTYGEFRVGTGFTEQDRLNPAMTPRMLVKFIEAGTKNKPRHPVFVKWML